MRFECDGLEDFPVEHSSCSSCVVENEATRSPSQLADDFQNQLNSDQQTDVGPNARDLLNIE